MTHRRSQCRRPPTEGSLMRVIVHRGPDAALRYMWWWSEGPRRINAAAGGHACGAFFELTQRAGRIAPRLDVASPRSPANQIRWKLGVDFGLTTGRAPATGTAARHCPGATPSRCLRVSAAAARLRNRRSPRRTPAAGPRVWCAGSRASPLHPSRRASTESDRSPRAAERALEVRLTSWRGTVLARRGYFAD